MKRISNFACRIALWRLEKYRVSTGLRFVQEFGFPHSDWAGGACTAFFLLKTFWIQIHTRRTSCTYVVLLALFLQLHVHVKSSKKSLVVSDISFNFVMLDFDQWQTKANIFVNSNLSWWRFCSWNDVREKSCHTMQSLSFHHSVCPIQSKPLWQ